MGANMLFFNERKGQVVCGCFSFVDHILYMLEITNENKSMQNKLTVDCIFYLFFVWGPGPGLKLSRFVRVLVFPLNASNIQINYNMK